VSVLGLQMEWTVGPETGPDALQHLAVAFERAGAEVADLGKHVFPKLGPVFEAAVGEQFDAEGAGPVAGGWAGLSPSYAEWKNGHAPGAPLLVLSGQMRAALTSASSPQALRAWDSTSFSFGTRGVQYASFHQTGTGKMPARPPFDFGPEFEREVTRVTAQGVREAVREGSNGLLEVEGES
jgi:phage gpG-like protein